MSSIPNVFDFVTTSNRVRQTYFVGFVDINGGNLILRPNSNLFITGGDTSMNGALSVSGNTTIGSNLSIAGNITLSQNLIGRSDVSLNKNLFLGGDASLNGRLFVNQDVSLNGDLSTKGNVYVGQLNDACLNTLTTYSYDVSNTATFSTTQTYNNYPTNLGGNGGADKTIKVSATGQFMIISDYHNQKLTFSKDYGRTWNLVPFGSLNFYHCGISATGQYMIACVNSGSIYISKEFGNNFNATSISTLGSFAQTWSSVAISGNGQYMTAVMNSTTTNSGYAYVSRDNGQNWAQVQLGNVTPVQAIQCGRCAMSSDGKYQIVSIANNGTNYYLSSNYGINFELKTFTPSIAGNTISAPTNKWWDVAVSSSGKYMLISTHSGNNGCYYSKDYGLTWSVVGGISTSGNYNSVAMSANGQYMMFASTTSIGSGSVNTLYIQNNSPGTVGINVSTALLSSSDGINNATFASCAISADGKYFTAISRTTTNTTIQNITNVYIVEPTKTTLSNSYSYRTTPPSLLNVQGSTNPITLLDNSVLFSNQPPILLSSFGNSWNQLDGFSMMSAYNIHTSATGQYVLIDSGTNGAGQLSLSNNYGSTFTYFSPTNLYQNWADYTCSANGQYQTAVIDGGFTITSVGVVADNSFNSGNVYISNDFGATFRPSRVLLNTPMSWTAMSLSANGQYQTGTVNGSILSNGGIYVSSNYGVNWRQIVPTGTNASTNWVEISMSATGQFQTALVSGGLLYTSSNFGNTWNPVTSIGSKIWSFVSVSSTGQYQTAVVNGEYIYISTNYGATWTANTSAGVKTWVSCSMTANAQYQIAVEGLVLSNGIANSGGQAWYSTNYGVTWNSGGLSQGPYTGVTTNANGQFSYLVSSAGAFFVNALGSPATVPSSITSQSINGILTVGSSTTLNGTLTVAGASTLNSTLTVAGANSTLTVAGATTLSSTLGVAGATTLNNTLNVTGANSTLTVAGATTLSSTLGVAGASTLSSTLNVTGASTLNGPVTINPTTSSLNILPAGMIMAWVSSNPPTGWLICNGNEYNAQTEPKYQALYNIIFNTFGGTNNTNFKVPNYQGAFLRGTGNQSKTYNSTTITYAGPAVDNTGQSHATQTHSHGITGSVSFGASNTITGTGMTALSTNNYNGTSNSLNSSLAISNSSSSGGTITDTNETRPFNYGVYWVIKY